MPSTVANNVLRTGGKERTRYVVTFRPNGASPALPLDLYSSGAILRATGVGTGPIDHPATGQFRVFFDNSTFPVAVTAPGTAGRKLVGVIAQLSFNGATGNRAYAGGLFASGGSMYFDVWTVNAADAAVDLAADASTRVTLEFEFEEAA